MFPAVLSARVEVFNCQKLLPCTNEPRLKVPLAMRAEQPFRTVQILCEALVGRLLIY